MPELVAHYHYRVCALVGDDDLAHSHTEPLSLSLHRSSAVAAKAVWLGAGGPALVRNYDFRLDVVADCFEATNAWSGMQGDCQDAEALGWLSPTT